MNVNTPISRMSPVALENYKRNMQASAAAVHRLSWKTDDNLWNRLRASAEIGDVAEVEAVTVEIARRARDRALNALRAEVT